MTPQLPHLCARGAIDDFMFFGLTTFDVGGRRGGVHAGERVAARIIWPCQYSCRGGVELFQCEFLPFNGVTIIGDTRFDSLKLKDRLSPFVTAIAKKVFTRFPFTYFMVESSS